jgi:2-dehydro-3-deoxyphosphooctonate aldolase (KDO 8-P synthase)
MTHEVEIGNFKVGAGNRPFLIAGPCVIESEQLVLETAARIADRQGSGHALYLQIVLR